MNDAIVDAADKHFASDYFKGRERFRVYAREAAVGEPAIYPYPARGPRGRELSTNVAWFWRPTRPPSMIPAEVVAGRQSSCSLAPMRSEMKQNPPQQATSVSNCSRCRLVAIIA